jgi:hypothetical protein
MLAWAARHEKDSRTAGRTDRARRAGSVTRGRGRTRLIAETRKLDEINTIFDEVLAGRVPAPVVLEF